MRTLRIVIAMDKFKGSVSAQEAAHHLAAGLRAALPGADVATLPLADGGEGFLDGLLRARGGTAVKVTVAGPLGDPVAARMAFLADGRTAVIESAEACGLWRLPPDLRDPWRATSRGVGELLRCALARGCRRLLVGIGGTASNDGGAGLARALGARLLDAHGRDVADGACGLQRLHRVELSGLDARLRGAECVAACDVSNPLCGSEGASTIYGPQKGAAPGDVAALDAALARYADAVEAAVATAGGASGTTTSFRRLPGAGAGGGIGFTLAALAGARLEAGSALVLREVGARDVFRRADLVVTGEGRLDASTLHGKLPLAVARLAGEEGVPVAAVCGDLALDASTLRRVGFVTALSLAGNGVDAEQAVASAPRLLESAGRRLANLLRSGRL